MTSDLDKRITFQRIALNCANEDPGHATYHLSLIADLQNMLRKLESASHIPDLSGYTTFLCNLVVCIGDINMLLQTLTSLSRPHEPH